MGVLNEFGVAEGGAVPSGSVSAQMPITGCAFTCDGFPCSSTAATTIDRVRLACAVIE